MNMCSRKAYIKALLGDTAWNTTDIVYVHFHTGKGLSECMQTLLIN